MRRASCVVLAIVLVQCCALPLAAQKRNIKETDIFQFKWIGDPQISPDGSRVAFDQCVVATGARNRRFEWPGLDLPGVFDLRFAPDADAIRAAASSASRAVLVGMGFIGAEVAASLRQLGLDVTVVEFFGTPLERVLGPELGSAIEALHRDHGVQMVFHDAAERFEGDGRFEAVVTQNGRRIEGDLNAIVGGLIANEVGAGFLGGLVAGLLAGAVVMWLKRIPVPGQFRRIVPILVYLIAGFPGRRVLLPGRRWVAEDERAPLPAGITMLAGGDGLVVGEKA